MIRSFGFSLLFSSFWIVSLGQSTCGFHLEPNLHSEWANGLQDYDKENIRFRDETWQVPVVFHILYRTDDQNIGDSQIHSQIEVLNDDFRRGNGNLNQTADAFIGLAADCEIEFCLARRTPEGESTTGITRRQVTETNVGSGDTYFKSQLGGQDAWDVSRYLNIWVCEIAGDVFGFATFPGMASPPESDGIVIQPQFVGTTGTARNSKPNHLGRTLTHEIGHYFGLVHPWGNDGSDCDEDDLIDDTPFQEGGSMGCPTFPLRDICSPRTPGVQFYNYMDYTDDSCMTMFTIDQKMRMRAAILSHRPEILTSPGCETVSSIDIDDHQLLLHSNLVSDKLCWTSTLPVHSAQILGLSGLQLNNNDQLDDCLNVSFLDPGMYFIEFEVGKYKKAYQFVKF